MFCDVYTCSGSKYNKENEVRRALKPAVLAVTGHKTATVFEIKNFKI
jgi:hypothetical protein